MGIVGAARRRRRGRLWGTAIGTIAAVGVAATVGLGALKSSQAVTTPAGPHPLQMSDLLLRPAPVQTESLGGLVAVNVPIVDGLVDPTGGAPVVTVYRPDPKDRQVTLVWLESPTADCGQASAVHVDERPDSVVVEVSLKKESSDSCAAVARMATAVITLSAPLGTRTVKYLEGPTG